MTLALATAKLARQSYGMAMSQCTYGGPQGVWLECTTCVDSQVILGSRAAVGEPNPIMDASDAEVAEVAEVFRRHGWTGRGDRMLGAKCPMCSAVAGSVRIYQGAVT